MDLTNIPVKTLNSRFIDKIESQGLIKEAADSVSGFTRDILRENGIARQIVPPIVVTEDDFDRDVNTDKPKLMYPSAVSLTLVTLRVHVTPFTSQRFSQRSM